MTPAWATPFPQHSVCLVRVWPAFMHTLGAGGTCILHCQEEPWSKALSHCHPRLCSLATHAGWKGSEKPPIAMRRPAPNPAKEASQGTGKYHWTPASVWGFSLDSKECKITLAKTSRGARSGLFYPFYIYNCNVNCHGVHLYTTLAGSLQFSSAIEVHVFVRPYSEDLSPLPQHKANSTINQAISVQSSVFSASTVKQLGLVYLLFP